MLRRVGFGGFGAAAPFLDRFSREVPANRRLPANLGERRSRKELQIKEDNRSIPQSVSEQNNLVGSVVPGPATVP